MKETWTMIEARHQLAQSEPDGEIYCVRCGLYNPSEEEEPCVPICLTASDSSLPDRCRSAE